MSTYKTFNKKVTSQTEKASSKQVKNNAGGYTFEVSDEQRIRRFLILGSNTNTFYQSGTELTKENGEFLIRAAENTPELLVGAIEDVYRSGSAAKQDPTLLALAIAVSYIQKDSSAYKKALSLISELRTATHLFTLVDYAQQFRGWGRSFREAVAQWYLGRDTDKLAYQMVKYRNRNGWTHRDVLRKSHPSTTDPAKNALLKWTTSGEVGELPPIVTSYLQANSSDADVAAQVRENKDLTWEMLPTESLKDPDVWEALVHNGIPMTALIRNLSRLSRLELTPQMGGLTNKIVEQISNKDALNKARVHPMQILFASSAYSVGYSTRSANAVWAVNPKIVDALNDAFYLSFGSFEPAGKRTFIGLDVSGSMGIRLDPFNPLTAKSASVALSLVQLATEKNVTVTGFTSKGHWRNGPHLEVINLSAKRSIEENVREAQKLPFGSTDCALPMLYAAKNEIEVDTFIIYTDNETWAGDIHPHQALQQYRNKMGIPAKLVVVGMTSTGFSIADPDDTGMLDVVGFDASTPKIINDFSAGRI